MLSKLLCFQTAVDIVASVSRWVDALGSDSPVATGNKDAHETLTQEQGFLTWLISPLLHDVFSSSPKQVDTKSPPQELSDKKLQCIKRSLQLQVYIGKISVKLPHEVAFEITRATRKESPSNIEYHIVYVWYL